MTLLGRFCLREARDENSRVLCQQNNRQFGVAMRSEKSAQRAFFEQASGRAKVISRPLRQTKMTLLGRFCLREARDENSRVLVLSMV